MADSPPTVQRTLVKSPPELWADLSDPESLARRLGEFGEIRITRLVPEKTVVWEGERASGTVEIESSGWGTRVRLSASATAPPIDDAPAPDADPALDAALRAELEREAAIEAALLAEVEREAAIEAALRAEIEREAELEAALEAQAVFDARAELEAERVRLAADDAERALARDVAPPGPSAGEPGAATGPVQPRGFFARFRKRRRPEPTAPARTAQPGSGPAPGPRPTALIPVTRPTLDPPRPGPTATRPPAAPHHRPPVRLAALAFAPAKPAGRVPAATNEAEAPAESQTPSAETPTGARSTRSEKPAQALPDARSQTPADARRDARSQTPADAPRDARSETPADAQPTRSATRPRLDDERTIAVLRTVLDDLGSAHHRPFSRE
jgi:hypothetical protein